MDFSELFDRVGGDATLVQEVTSIFLEEYPVLLNQIREAVHNGDSEQLESAAHSLKGCIANFGAPEAVRAAFQLESLGRNRQLGDSSSALVQLEARLAEMDPALRDLAAEPARYAQ